MLVHPTTGGGQCVGTTDCQPGEGACPSTAQSTVAGSSTTRTAPVAADAAAPGVASDAVVDLGPANVNGTRAPTLATPPDTIATNGDGTRGVTAAVLSVVLLVLFALIAAAYIVSKPQKQQATLFPAANPAAHTEAVAADPAHGLAVPCTHNNDAFYIARATGSTDSVAEYAIPFDADISAVAPVEESGVLGDYVVPAVVGADYEYGPAADGGMVYATPLESSSTDAGRSATSTVTANGNANGSDAEYVVPAVVGADYEYGPAAPCLGEVTVESQTAAQRNQGDQPYAMAGGYACAFTDGAHGSNPPPTAASSAVAYAVPMDEVDTNAYGDAGVETGSRPPTTTGAGLYAVPFDVGGSVYVAGGLNGPASGDAVSTTVPPPPDRRRQLQRGLSVNLGFNRQAEESML